MRRAFLIILIASGIAPALLNCAATLEVTRTDEILRRRVIARQQAIKYERIIPMVRQRVTDEHVEFVLLATARQLTGETIKAEDMYITRTRLRDEFGRLNVRIWTPFSWGTRRKKMLPADYIKSQLWRIIPSLGISLVVAVVDGVTLPLRLLSGKRGPRVRTVRNQTNEFVALDMSGGAVKCGDKVYGSESYRIRIPFRELLRLVPPDIRAECTVTFPAPANRTRKVYLNFARFYGKSAIVRNHFHDKQRLVLFRLAELLHGSRDRDRIAFWIGLISPDSPGARRIQALQKAGKWHTDRMIFEVEALLDSL